MINQIAGKVLEKCFFSFHFSEMFIPPGLEIIRNSALVGTLHLYLLAGIFFETYFSIESEGLSSISEDKIL